MKFSLKSKLTLSMSVLFVLFSSAVTWFTLSIFQQKLEQALVAQQASLAGSLALSIDNKLHMARTAMAGAASRLTPDIAGDPKKAGMYLDSRPTLQSIFDNGIFLFSKDGRLIAESSYLSGDSPENVARMEELCRAMAGSSRISSANHVIASTKGGKAAIFMTVPVMDRSGRMYAIFGGRIDPYGRNFLEEISRIGIGGNGFLYICDNNRRIIVHQNRARLFEPVPEGANQLLDHAEGGFARSGITNDPTTGETLTSFRHLDSTGWFIAVNLPLKEAYAPLHAARLYFMVAIFVGTIAVLVSVWFLAKHITAPLRTMTDQLARLSERPEGNPTLLVERDDELGTLAEAFNGMVGALGIQQKQLEETAATAENEKARAEAVIASIGEALCILDRDYRVLYQNRIHRDLIDDHRGEICYTAFHGAKDVCDGCPVAKVFSNGQMHEVQKDVVTRGERKCIEIIASPLRNSAGTIVAAIEVVRDNTASRRREEEIETVYADLQRKATELEYANREHEAFGYSLSHDLKVPLTRIGLAAQTLSDLYGDQFDDSGKFCIESISKGSTRMEEMIEGMLLLSRIPRSDLLMEEIDLSMVAEEFCQRLASEHPDRKVAWTVEPGIRATGDPRLLKSVIENLLMNSWKYTARTMNAQVAFGSVSHEGEQVILIRDNGVGFGFQDRERIFQPFQRVHRNEEFEGSGIGLATVQRIVERHGGRVWAEGEPGNGATFYFTLPPRG